MAGPFLFRAIKRSTDAKYSAIDTCLVEIQQERADCLDVVA